MPLYTFDCPACGKGFEEFLRLREAEAGMPCPDCGTLSHAGSGTGAAPGSMVSAPSGKS
jgi:putative FmdB family regulatory protein